MSLTSDIKKYSLKYVHCPHGGLHAGEVMNMVCVDSVCSHRGLICPICRMENHQTHQILPIKSFLEQIRSMFTQTDNNDDLNNLSDYLRSLQNSKKSVIGFLRTQVANLASTFKSLQEKIQQNYANVRKNVLIQSSITTKLPTLLTLLTEQNANKDSELIREQFKKYTELLKYEDNKLKVSDKAKTLVQSYSTLPAKLESLLETYSSEFSKKLETIPKFFQEKQTVAQKGPSSIVYTFSTENKFFDIVLEEENKLAKCPDIVEENGFIFVNQNKGGQKQKIILEITANQTGSISVGLGDVEVFRNQCSFISEGIMDQKKDSYQFVYSSGSNKSFNSSSDSEQIEKDISNQFVTGDILEVCYDGVAGTLNIFNRMTLTNNTLNTTFSQKSKGNLQFVIGLGPNDSVKILEQ